MAISRIPKILMKTVFDNISANLVHLTQNGLMFSVVSGFGLTSHQRLSNGRCYLSPTQPTRMK